MRDAAVDADHWVFLSFVHTRSKFPGTQIIADVLVPGDDLVHSGTFRRVILDHVGDEGSHEVKPDPFHHEFLPDHIANIVDVGWKWIDKPPLIVLKFRHGLIAASYGLRDRVGIVRLELTR